MRPPEIASDGWIALIRRLFRETGRDFVGRYLLVFVFGLGIAGSTALTAWLIKDVVDKVFIDRRADILYLLTAVIVVNGFVRGFSLYASAVTLGRIGNEIVARTQRRLFDHLLNLGVDFYSRTPPGELVTRMSHNAQAARDVLQTIMTSTSRDFLVLIALVTVMFIQNPVMSLIVLVIGPIIILGIARLLKRVRGVARAQFTSLSAVISEMQQAAHGIRIIKAFNLESPIRERMSTAVDLVRRRADKIIGLGARTGPLVEILAGLAIAAVILWAGYQTIYLGVPPGALMSFLAAIALAYDPARRLVAAQIPLGAGLVGVRLMYELLDTKPTMRVNEHGPELKVAAGEVVFDDVSFSYRGDTPLFRGLRFTAAGGKTTALVGPSGAGKTTMIALIERFFDVDGGRILIDGQDIAAVKLSSLRDQTALVSQDIVLFNDTIRENIRFGRPEASDAEIERAAKDAMAHDFIMAMPDGYDTVVDSQTSQLSGGERQRITIARAMLRDAHIVLLDEATSSLDSESEYQVQVAFERLMRGRTTIVIAHRLSTVLGADMIAVLVNGKIAEQGRHADLLALGKHYARFYHLQFEPRGSEPKTDGLANGSLSVPAQ